MSTAGSQKDLELKEHGSEPDLDNKETSLMKNEMESDDPEVQAKAIAKRMSQIVDTALDRLKPFLEMMVEVCASLSHSASVFTILTQTRT